MRADQRGAELLHPIEQPVSRGVADCEAARARVLLEPDAAQIHAAAVEQQPPADDLHRADPDPPREPLQDAAGPGGRQRRVIEPRLGRRPQPRVRDPQRVRERHGRPGGNGHGADPQAARAPAADDAHRSRAVAMVAQDHVPAHRRGAARARELGTHVDGLEVDVPDLAQIDLAQDAAVIPPATERPPLDIGLRRWEVARRAPTVDAHDQAVHPPTAQPARGDVQFERQVGPGVGAELAAVDPDPRSIVDRLEAQNPGFARTAAWKAQVTAVPGDRTEVRGKALVGGVPRVGHRDAVPSGHRGLPLPAGALAGARRVQTPQPRPVDQIPTGRPVGRQRPRREAASVRSRRRRRRRRDDRQEDGSNERSRPDQREHAASPRIFGPIETMTIFPPRIGSPRRSIRTHCTTGRLCKPASHATRVRPASAAIAFDVADR
ncbi:unannotated protein [freshwater metagenome]|uniref:Unannotated protein n=1 Tax=freshwater metagenome TaxID=449393 RepID=A0A6J7E1T7_9ZZZZ